MPKPPSFNCVMRASDRSGGAKSSFRPYCKANFVDFFVGHLLMAVAGLNSETTCTNAVQHPTSANERHCCKHYATALGILAADPPTCCTTPVCLRRPQLGHLVLHDCKVLIYNMAAAQPFDGCLASTPGTEQEQLSVWVMWQKGPLRNAQWTCLIRLAGNGVHVLGTASSSKCRFSPTCV